MAKLIEQVVPRSAQKQRLDQYLAEQQAGLSRTRIQNLIREQRVVVNAHPVKPNYRLRAHDIICIHLPPPIQPDRLCPESLPLDILYEDEWLLLINKAAGMVVHPAAGHYTGTLANALLAHCTNLSGINGVLKPGIVHRLDKDTSGLLVVAKSDLVHQHLAAQLARRTMTRSYRALVWGNILPDTGTVIASIGRHQSDRKKMAVTTRQGREAITHYRVGARFGVCTDLTLKLETGRTHQIRVHLAHMGHPVVGDGTYGGRHQILGRLTPRQRRLALAMLAVMPRQALHAAKLGFIHPIFSRTMEFETPLPDDMANLLAQLQSSPP